MRCRLNCAIYSYDKQLSDFESTSHAAGTLGGRERQGNFLGTKTQIWEEVVSCLRYFAFRKMIAVKIVLQFGARTNLGDN